MNEFFERYKSALNRIRQIKPIVHHITNFVNMQDCANIVCAIGASPIMAYYEREVEEVSKIANSVVLNMGTPDPQRIKSIIKSGKVSNELNKPVVFDPVGVGATSFRQESSKEILKEVRPSIIKGNFSEMKYLSGTDSNVAPNSSRNSGVDSIENMDGFWFEKIISYAYRKNIVCAVTGKKDMITDGKKVCIIERGHDILGDISGSGCMATSLIGCFASIEEDMFFSAIYGILTLNIASEIGKSNMKEYEGAGAFKVRLFDGIYTLYNTEIIDKGGIYFA